MNQNFRSNGKLLITSEYLVLFGAQALALPIKFGQSMEVKQIADQLGTIRWKSFDPNGLWFEAQLGKTNLEITATNNHFVADELKELLKIAFTFKSNYSESSDSLEFTHHLDYPLKWGLGSSSTLVSNLSYWLSIDPFQLHNQISKGSGYDIACARSSKPILFQRIGTSDFHFQTVKFNPDFSDSMIFIYSGQKQNTKESISNFTFSLPKAEVIDQINGITLELLKTTNIDAFISLMHEHELIVGNYINEKPIQRKKFKDFKGAIKSLGAWGGDFFLAVSDLGPEYIHSYFQSKNLNHRFNLNELRIPTA